MDDASRTILSIARDVMSDLDGDRVLDRVLAAARELTGARYAAIGIVDESRTELGHFEVLGIDDATRRRIPMLPRGRGLLGELISRPGPLRLADVAEDPRAYGFPENHPSMRTFLGVPVMVDGEAFGNLYLADRLDGAEFDAEDEEVVTVLAEFAGLAMAHARRLAASEARGISLQDTVAALDATTRIAQALGGHTDPATILDLVAERARELVAARELLIEVEREGGELEVAAAAGERAAQLIGRRLPLADTVASVALATRTSQRLSDAQNRLRFERRGLGAFGVDAADGLVVPMVFRNETYGVLVALARDEGDGFTNEQLRLLESFAASAASALATVRLAAVERRRQSLAAAEAERTRWARDLHDETLQGLASLRLLLATAQRRGAEAMAEVVPQALAQLDSDIAGLRALIADLRPPALDELGTEAAIRALAERHARAGFQVDVSVDLAYEQGRSADRHVPELETAIYRIVQEALTNAERHGGARNAVVEIEERDGSVRIVVRDDGRGFDPASPTAGYGLTGMRERVELLGGTLAVASAPGGRTAITASLPVALRPIRS